MRRFLRARGSCRWFLQDRVASILDDAAVARPMPPRIILAAILRPRAVAVQLVSNVLASPPAHCQRVMLVIAPIATAAAVVGTVRERVFRRCV